MNNKQLEFNKRTYFKTGERKKESLLQRRMKSSMKESLTLSTTTEAKTISPYQALRRGDYDIDTNDLELVHDMVENDDEGTEQRINSFLNA